MKNLNLVLEKTPNSADNQILFQRIIEFNERHIHEKPNHFSVFLRDEENKLFGGISVYAHSDTIYIDLLWVDEIFRRQGYGKRLLNKAEHEAIQRGCKYSIVDTMDFQAIEFYQKNGYQEMGQIKDYLLGHSRIFLRKKFVGANRI